MRGIAWSEILKAETRDDRELLIHRYMDRLALLGCNVSDEDIEVYNDTEYKGLEGARLSQYGAFELHYGNSSSLYCIPPNINECEIWITKCTKNKVLKCSVTGLNGEAIPYNSMVRFYTATNADDIDVTVHLGKRAALYGDIDTLHLKCMNGSLSIVNIEYLKYVKHMYFDENVALLVNTLKIEIKKLMETVDNSLVEHLISVLRNIFKNYMIDAEKIVTLEISSKGRVRIYTSLQGVVSAIELDNKIEELLGDSIVRGIVNSIVNNSWETG